MSIDTDTEDTPEAPVTTEAHADTPDDLHHHEIPDRTYILIAVFLAVLTAAEVAVTEIAGMPEALLIPSLLIMMAIKFFVVVSYFMHLKHDSAIFKFGFYVGLIGAAVLYSVVLATFHFFIS